MCAKRVCLWMNCKMLTGFSAVCWSEFWAELMSFIVPYFRFCAVVLCVCACFSVGATQARREPAP